MFTTQIQMRNIMFSLYPGDVFSFLLLDTSLQNKITNVSLTFSLLNENGEISSIKTVSNSMKGFNNFLVWTLTDSFSFTGGTLRIDIKNTDADKETFQKIVSLLSCSPLKLIPVGGLVFYTLIIHLLSH